MDRRRFLKGLCAAVATAQVNPAKALEALSVLQPPPTAPEIGAFAEAAGFPGIVDLEDLITRMTAHKLAEDVDRALIMGDGTESHTEVLPAMPLVSRKVEFNPVLIGTGFKFKLCMWEGGQ